MIKPWYEKFFLPKLCDKCCSTKPINYQRNKVVPLAQGVVLEIGMGSGLNIPFYNKNNIEKIIGLDPSEELNFLAKKVAKKNNIEIDFIISGAEDIALPDNSIDTILITYTLCTIPDLDNSMAEIKRVLKSDGKFIFCEHGIAPDQNIVKWQTRINPIWKALMGGCNINRNIPKIISDGGFDITNINEMYLPSTPKIVGYNYWGIAEK
ncbi:class I SAM-dependent methyltransferase [Gammaproteobacteria bacterium]|nr:class I SAM-dependent methyltransferase [Gammaproteobacteria bacterium]